MSTSFKSQGNVFTLPCCYHNVNLFNKYVFLSALGFIKASGTQLLRLELKDLTRLFTD